LDFLFCPPVRRCEFCKSAISSLDKRRRLCPEIMGSTKAIKAMIRDKKERQMLSTLETSSSDGMTTMNKSLIKLVRDRKITKSEAILYSPDKDTILNLL